MMGGGLNYVLMLRRVMKNFILPIPLSSLNSSAIGASYVAINVGGLPKACSILRIINASSQAVTISYDGSIDHEYLASGATLQLDFQTNKQPNGQVALLRAGTTIYAKGTAGTGFVAVVGYYQEL